MPFPAPDATPGVIALPEREDVSDEFKWRLSDIYATADEWESDFRLVRGRLPELAARRGTLGRSAGDLLSCLRLCDEISITVGRLHAYALMKSHEDMRDSGYQALSGRAGTLAVDLSSAASFITPEIISMPEERLWAITREDGADFSDYMFMLKEITRQKAHVLSEAEEGLLAQSGEMAAAPEDIFSMLTNADMKFAPIKDEEGREVEMSDERYIKYVSSRDRSVRKAAFDSLYGAYAAGNNTLGAAFNGMLKTARFYSGARKFGSDLESALDGPGIPVAVYDNLITAIEGNLEPLHRYMSLRKRILGLDELHMYDIYCPLVENPYKDIPWETAKFMVAEALVPLGPDYMAHFRRGLESGWIDVYANRGKRGGAYSWGTWGTHPYILLNYNGELSDVSTLAHEMGHSMHTFYSHKSQPYPMCGYTIFCAEIASTTNEELLADCLIRNTTEREKRIYLLNQHLERIRATVYRQTMFASFERDVHARSKNGQDTTAAELGRMWLGLNKKYFGPDVAVDAEIAFEWSRIPHFYSPFYVYQYATGFSAASALSRMIASGGRPAAERYIKFLSSGGSGNPIDLLLDAGVDMRTPGPITDTIKVFSETLDEIERLC
ncbi:MAG: oligoendopeptidase F [Synergistaceae bacterium]|nr:oligoendopeptidase F [Synergistaceae bacterium]